MWYHIPDSENIMSGYSTIRTILDEAIDAGVGVLESNVAYRIYQDLHQKLAVSSSIDTFWAEHADIDSMCKQLISFVDANSPNQGHTTRYKLLGAHLEQLLKPRFVMETNKSPDETEQHHIIHWFEDNAGLNFDTDRVPVQAGYIAIFYV